MDIHVRKLELVQLILNTSKTSILERVSKILKVEQDEDWYDEMPDELKEELELSIQEAERGEVIEHNSAMEEIRKRSNV